MVTHRSQPLTRRDRREYDPAQEDRAVAELQTLKLSRKAKKAAAKVLANRGRVKAKIMVAATDQVGNTGSAKRKVTVTAGRKKR